MNFRYARFLIPILVSFFFSEGAVFAESGKTAAPAVKTVAEVKEGKEARPTNVADETASGSADDVEEKEDAVAKQEREREKQKAMDDINAFLIESYKIKLDKLLDEVYRSVRAASKDDPKLQTILLRRIQSEIEGKLASANERPISANRKKILVSVFSYLKADIESKIRSIASE